MEFMGPPVSRHISTLSGLITQVKPSPPLL
jgi:hypothetical protein